MPMRSAATLLALPTSLLLLVSSSAVANSLDAQWPYNLPPHVKYYPEDEALVRRNAEIQEKLRLQNPQALRKMSHDEGEMFFLDYWDFGHPAGERGRETPGVAPRGVEADDRAEWWLNSTLLPDPLPPLLLHGVSQVSLVGRWLRPHVAALAPRDFACPTGTASCVSIDQPNSCCATGLTCQSIPPTELGDVGCCPAGLTCSGQVGSCPAGYTACPANLGGGCCIPGYQCNGVGCVLSSTATVLVQPTATATSTTTSPTSTSTTPTPTPTSAAAAVTTPPQTLTCSTGFRTCPASLGGGCCATDRACGSVECPATATTGAAPTSPTASSAAPSGPAPAVRPTSLLNTTSAGTTSAPACPTGFYMCSAYYIGGGCCQVGRDCALTSCPPTALTTVLASDGVTVVVPGTATGAAGARCAAGWGSCGADVGGGCCPSGFSCGTASCSVAATGTAAGTTVPKEAAGGGRGGRTGPWRLCAAVLLGAGAAVGWGW